MIRWIKHGVWISESSKVKYFTVANINGSISGLMCGSNGIKSRLSNDMITRFDLSSHIALCWTNYFVLQCYIDMVTSCPILHNRSIMSISRWSFQGWYFHYKDKKEVWQTYLYDENPLIGKTTSLYWDGPLVTHLCVREPTRQCFKWWVLPDDVKLLPRPVLTYSW